MSFKVGTATRDITPESGSRMAAFPRGPDRVPRRANGVLDPLMVRALTIEDGKEHALFCSADLCILRAESVQRIREKVATRVPEISSERIVVAVTHTHSGAETSFLFGATPDDPEVLRIEEAIVDVLVSAWSDRECTSLSIGTQSLDLTHNRRVRGADGRSSMALESQPGLTTGPVDPELLTLTFTNMGGMIKAVVFHYTAHALTLGPGNDQFSADFPGRACRWVEEAFSGATALFFNGAAGNVHPVKCMRAGPQALEEIGCRVGQAVVAAVGASSRVSKPALRMLSERITFRNRACPELEVPVELGMVFLAPLFLALVPGELFVEYQLRFKQAIAPSRGSVIGYANGWPGYIPTRDAYTEGGYGVDLATGDPPHYSRTALPVEAGDVLLARLVAMAVKIAPNGR